jgi:hypothetical protein
LNLYCDGEISIKVIEYRRRIMALSLDINKSEPKDKYVEELWKNFVENYNYVGESGFVIKYPDEVYREQGIPSPWQIIAWRKIVRKIGEQNFNDLPFRLNYQENDNVLFEEQFTERFGKHPSPEKLRVTFICGYFWKFNPNRRKKMLEFVVNSLLKKGTNVEIWTQDDTLAESFGEKIGISPTWDRLHFNFVKERIDVHFTLIEDESAEENSLFLLELPHTEAHLFRLETYLTSGDLKKFGLDPGELKSILRGYTKQKFYKKWFSNHDLALNTG